MPEATITFYDGTTARLHITSLRAPRVGHTIDGSPAHVRRNTVSLKGDIVEPSATLTQRLSGIQHTIELSNFLDTLDAPPRRQKGPRTSKKPKPKSAWDRLLSEESVVDHEPR